MLIYYYLGKEKPMDIPYHSLIFCETYNDLNLFPIHERLSIKIIENSLVGDNQRFRSSSIIFGELYHRINLKLSLGERTAVYVGDLSSDEKNHLSSLVNNQGAYSFNFKTGMTLLHPFLKDDWKGITVVGDVHGDKKALLSAIKWAKSRQHYVWFLGDIIDYGKDTLETMNIVYELVMHGKASMILGNHERKIARWIEQREKGNVYLRISDGNRVTVNAIENLRTIERKKWIGRYRGLLAHAQLMQRFSNATIVHAAAHPSLWNEKQNDIAIEQFALYGESIHMGKTYTRTYDWIDSVPKNETVIVGHDVLHTYPSVKTGKSGGNVVFLDTGAGKGGFLSSADLKFENDGIHLECFKRY
jgi:protein phosphatase